MNHPPQPDTVDLEIRIGRCHEEQYPLEVELDRDQVWRESLATAGLTPWVASTAQADGERLFKALFGVGTMPEMWATVCERARERMVRLRLYLDQYAPELHVIPWELLYDPRDGAWLAASSHTAFSRFMPIALPWRGTVEDTTLRMLVVLSNPTDLDQYNLAALDVEQERSLFAALPGKPEEAAYQLEVTFLEPPVTLERLDAQLQEGYHIVHYLGHGAFNARRQQAALYLQDATGAAAVTPDAALAQMFARQQNRPLLIVLAACQSAVRSTGEAYSGLAVKLVQAGAPAVIAMQDFLNLEDGRRFNQRLYQRLQSHGQVDRAVCEARSLLVSQGGVSAAVATPVLLTRLRANTLWSGEADQRGAVLGEKSESFWSDLLAILNRGQCVPIIGPRVHGRWLPTLADIAREWAQTKPIYPFSDDSVLGRVAQYRSRQTNLGRGAIQQALVEFMVRAFKARLPEELREKLEGSGGDAAAGATRGPRARRTATHSLSEMLDTLGWQTIAAADPNDAHTVLASLGLPFYFTTNPDGAMETALKAGDIPVDREICRWNEDVDHLPSLFEEGEYVPTPEHPLVYHLFGHDSIPESLVVTDDDYLQFLVKTAADMDRIPNYVRGMLSSNLLLLIGYGITDWEFKVIMQGLIMPSNQRRRFKHVAVQLDSEGAAPEVTENVQTFLAQYFQDANINVFWGSTEQFLAELHERWEAAAV